MIHLTTMKMYKKSSANRSQTQLLTMSIDIWRSIFVLMSIQSQLRMISTCSFFVSNIFISKLSSKKYVNNLTNDILKQSKYTNIRYLNVMRLKNFIDLPVFIYLQVLVASYAHGIKQKKYM